MHGHQRHIQDHLLFERSATICCQPDPCKNAREYPGPPKIGPECQKNKIQPSQATQSCMDGAGSMFSDGLAS